MSSQKINDYLTKQIFIEKNVVTYRSISREFSIHVNDAKNELATYHDNAPFQGQSCFATYLICGEVTMEPSQTQESYMDVNMSQPALTYIEADSEETTQTRITLVNEGDLEATKAQYVQVNSIHVYSLAPSPLIDADLICTPTTSIRATDAQRGAEFVKLVGKIVGKGVQEPKRGMSIREAKAAAALKKDAAKASTIPAKGNSKQLVEPVKEKARAEVKSNSTIKPTGKLDFFKAKPKDTKKEEPTAKAEQKKQFFTATVKPKPASRAPSVVSDKETPVEQAEKRGVKRKSVANTLSDTENEPSTSAGPSKPPSHSEASKLRVKKGVVLSDEEMEDAPQKPRRKTKTVDVHSEENREVMSLMDVDDNQVLRVSRAVDDADVTSETTEPPDETGTEVQSEDVPMDEEPVAAAKPKRKKAKAIPVGRNGLKKKRVVKSRRIKDEKGYTITQDFSEYESVDEEDVPPPKPLAKGKQKARKEPEDTDTVSIKAKTAKEPAPKKAAVKPKPKTTTATKQKGIAGFFGPAKPKK